MGVVGLIREGLLLTLRSRFLSLLELSGEGIPWEVHHGQPPHVILIINVELYLLPVRGGLKECRLLDHLGVARLGHHHQLLLECALPFG